jgi:hypothetical protein
LLTHSRPFSVYVLELKLVVKKRPASILLDSIITQKETSVTIRI